MGKKKKSAPKAAAPAENQTAAPAPAAPVVGGTVRALHILAKHTGRPPVKLYHTSDRTGLQIAVSPEEAHKELTALLANLNPNNFMEAARSRSDCGSYENGGDVGEFTEGEMQQPFWDATVALPLNQISELAETDSGFHIIMRTQ